MSAREIQGLAQQFADAFSNKDVEAVLGMLSEDVEVFDHVPYRFDDKAQFGAYLGGAVSAFASMSFAFRQPSCRPEYCSMAGLVWPLKPRPSGVIQVGAVFYYTAVF